MSYGFNAAEVFKIAVQIEENGKRFYEEGRKIVKEPAINALFEELEGQEIEHKKKFETLLTQLPSDASSPVVWDPDNDLERYIKMMADLHVFVSSESLESQLARVTDVVSALKLAIDFEKDSVLFFLSMEEAAENKKGQELIRQLMREEQEHLKRLTLELKRVTR
jgi:rubrerythrin